MKTLDYLKRYAYTYFYAAAAVLVFAAVFSRAVTQVASMTAVSERPVIVIDAGHGGVDGGTTSCTGVLESEINLQIALRLDGLLGLMGYDRVMVRTDSNAISTEGETIRAQKMSDLKNRVALVNGQPNAILVSIHQNHYPDSRYAGPQVFYAHNSQALAQAMQARLNAALGTERTCRQSSGVYLMEHITAPGVLVECGFLSNPNEEALLRSGEYQKKLCAILAAALAEYMEIDNSLTRTPSA